jgi:hypothetical protein
VESRWKVDQWGLYYADDDGNILRDAALIGDGDCSVLQHISGNDWAMNVHLSIKDGRMTSVDHCISRISTIEKRHPVIRNGEFLYKGRSVPRYCNYFYRTSYDDLVDDLDDMMPWEILEVLRYLMEHYPVHLIPVKMSMLQWRLFIKTGGVLDAL